jgi:hypothetical protein
MIDYGERAMRRTTNKLLKGKEVKLTMVKDGAPVQVTVKRDQTTGELDIRDRQGKPFIPSIRPEKKESQGKAQKNHLKIA